MSTQTIKSITYHELARRMPAGTKAMIVAKCVEDVSNPMTDHFDTRTLSTVFLAWSRHERDLFSELRKAAETFHDTAHLGTGKGTYTVSVVFASDITDAGCASWKGSPSHWHDDLFRDQRGRATFSTRGEAEAFIGSQPSKEPHAIHFGDALATFECKIGGNDRSIEHREKYSGGRGYYLKASARYSSGWEVKKVGLWRSEGDHGDQHIGIVRASAAARPPANAAGPIASASATAARSPLE